MSKVAALKRVPLEVAELEIPAGGPWNLERSQAYCLEMARQEPQNNHLAYWYLGKQLRPHVATLYAFVRSLHLAAEQPNHAELLRAWEHAIINMFRGHATHPVLVSMLETAEQYDMPVTPFTDLVVGARMMATQKRFASFATLMTYVEKISHPIGRVILLLAKDSEVDHIRAADDISTAMTLNAFWTYLADDFAKGRVHVPEEDMLRFGVTESDIKLRRVTPQLRELMEFEIARTRMYLMRGRPLCSHLPDSLRMELQMIWFSVQVSLDNLSRSNVFKDRTLRLRDWARAAVRLGQWRTKELVRW